MNYILSTGFKRRFFPALLFFWMYSIGILTVDADAQVSTQTQARVSAQTLEEQMKQYLKHDFFQLHLLFQNRMRYSVRNTGFQGGRTFQVPNARIGANGDLDGRFSYRVLFNVANSPSLLEASVGWKFNDWLRIKSGAMKPRISPDFIPNPAVHDFVDRSHIPAYFGLDWQLGVMAYGSGSGFSWYTGIFNGNGLNTNNNNVFDLLVRLEKRIPSGAGSLDIGLNGMYGEVTRSPSGMIGSVERVIAGADVRFDNEKVLLAGEYMMGIYESVNFNDTATLQGYYATAGYYTGYDLLILGRWQQWFHSESSLYEGSQITLGLKKFATSLISVELNIDVYYPESFGSDWQMGGSANMNFHF